MALDLRWHESARTLLRDLIRIDTSNPPGNELRACELLAEALVEGGVEPKIHRVAPERGNLVARLRGEDARLPPLLLSAHLDVVPADPVGWTHPPFAAEEADGCIWGRGAIDMKHMAAMAATVLLRMKAEVGGFRRDLILACVADEEVGGALGARWLVDNAPDDVRAGVALGEIGGMSLPLAGRRVYPVQVAEKGLAWLRLTARGAAGHGSVPDRSSAVVKLARAVEILGRTPLPTRMTPAARAFLAGTLDAVRGGLRFAAPLLGDTLVSAVLRLAGDSPTARVVGAMTANTATPTCLRAGTSTNAIPAEAVAEVDGRTLPGQNTADLVREIRAAIGKEIDIEVMHEAPPVEAPPDHPMLDAIRAVLREHDPGGAVVPSLTPGYTDAKAWSRLGIACYGFTPVRFPDDFPVQYSTLFHSTDERIPLEGFRFGLDVLGDLVERWGRGGVEGDR